MRLRYAGVVHRVTATIVISEVCERTVHPDEEALEDWVDMG